MSVQNVIARVRAWMVKATQISEPPQVDVRRTAFQLGMQLEELSEKLATIWPDAPIVGQLKQGGDMLKEGRHDQEVQDTLYANPKAFLDGDVDLLWVTAGSIAAQGADGERAWAKVDKANWDKFPNGVVTLHPVTKKVIKPEGWPEPDLTDCVHPSLLPKVLGQKDPLAFLRHPDEIDPSATPIRG